MVLEHQKQPGFNLGIVASLNIHPNLSLRFLPTLSFQERILQYQFRKPDGGSSISRSRWRAPTWSSRS